MIVVIKNYEAEEIIGVMHAGLMIGSKLNLPNKNSNDASSGGKTPRPVKVSQRLQ
jgi:hypothetical protein